MESSHNWKRSFITIYTGQAFSIIGSGAAQFAILWYLTARTGSPLVLSAAALAGFLPQALVGPFAGVWVDRVSRKRMMMGADSFIACVSALLAASFLFGEPPLWVFYAALFLRAVGSVFHSPAMQAAIPQLVPEEMLMRAGGWGELIQSGGLMIGPVLGAAMMAAGNLPLAMLVDVAGAAIAVGVLFFVRIPDPPPQAHDFHVLRDMADGLRAVRANRPLMAVSLPVLLCVLVNIPLSSLYPLMVAEHFGGGAWHSGLTEFLFAGGMLVSSLVIGVTGGLKRKFLMISLAITGFGAVLLASGLLPRGGFFAFALLCGAMGLTGNFFSVPYIVYIQETMPPETLGKALSLVMSAMSFSAPVGLLLAGPVAQEIGVANWFALSGAAITAVGIFCWFFTRRYERSA